MALLFYITLPSVLVIVIDYSILYSGTNDKSVSYIIFAFNLFIFLYSISFSVKSSESLTSKYFYSTSLVYLLIELILFDLSLGLS
mmetsp:Transcript_10059/g.896  ORF Transcript_10059/g.896 Transcript_10059/m.896 type:complete len:85 (+) Transcript_10059:1021-1275(+)